MAADDHRAQLGHQLVSLIGGARCLDDEFERAVLLVVDVGDGGTHRHSVAINRVKITGGPIPFGGWKQSGIGREGSRHGIEAFTELKYLCIDTAA